MANPLKIKYSGETFNGLQTMTNEEMDYSVHHILTEFIANTGPGVITTDSNYTSIGSFVDTTRSEDVGQTTPSGAITTVSTTTVYQFQSADQPETDMKLPLEFVSNTNPIIQQTDTNLNASLISRALSNLAANGLGSYVMQPSQPNSQYASVLTLTNTLSGNGSSSGNTTQIWRRTTAAAPTTVRPLKLGTTTGSIFEMTDSEIGDFIGRFRKRLYDTAIGHYVLQESAPGTGTWVRQGSAFIDARYIFGDDKNYVKAYTKTCLLYTSPSPRDRQKSRMPSSA